MRETFLLRVRNYISRGLAELATLRRFAEECAGLRNLIWSCVGCHIATLGVRLREAARYFVGLRSSHYFTVGRRVAWDCAALRGSICGAEGIAGLAWE